MTDNVQNRSNPGLSEAQQQQKQSPEEMLWSNERHLAAVLPSHMNVKSFIGTTIGALRANADLYNAAMRNPGSLVTALLHAARDGLQPGSAEFYLVVFGNAVTGIRGYQGEIALMYRGGQVASVIAECVYTSDKFSFMPGRDDIPTHEIDYDAENRGDLRLVYAYARMKDGAVSRVVVMGKPEVMRHKAASRSGNSSSSPWNKWESSMWLKTAVHELQKWTPKSAEFIVERLRASAAVELEGVRLRALPPSAPAAAGPSGMKNLDNGEQVDTDTGLLGTGDQRPDEDDASGQMVEDPSEAEENAPQQYEQQAIGTMPETAPAPWETDEFLAQQEAAARTQNQNDR